MSSSHRPFILLMVGVPLITLLLGWQLGMRYEQRVLEVPAISGLSGSGQVLSDPEKEADLSLLWQVWRLLQQRYIAPNDLKSNTMILGAIEGLVHGIGDPYTVFMPPKENADFRQTLEGKLQGIGAELTVKDGLVVVVSPLRGSPAERAGLLANDVLTEVDGKPVDGLTLAEVVALIRGPQGTSVHLKAVRQGKMQPLSFTIMRENISVPTVESKIITTSGGLLGYVDLNQFGENSMNEVLQALKGFQGKDLKGIVLDLRFNGGGYLDGAVGLTSMFVKKGEVVAVQDRNGIADRRDVSGNPLFPDTPLVVLINQSSASASEIVAGALQDLHRATIIGVKSFGKGTVQEVIDLPGGSSLRVTIARWLTPNGKNLGKQGVEPDIKIEPGADDVIGKQDAQLRGAIDWLILKKNDAKASRAAASSVAATSSK